MILFDKTLMTNNKTIDTQHRHLIDIFNRIKLNDSYDNHDIGIILVELIDYAEYHFKTEEELFEKYDYPDKEQHIIEHKEYVNKIKEFTKDYINNHIKIEDIDNFLIEWIIFHIKNSDQAYAKYFKENKIWK